MRRRGALSAALAIASAACGGVEARGEGALLVTWTLAGAAGAAACADLDVDAVRLTLEGEVGTVREQPGCDAGAAAFLDLPGGPYRLAAGAHLEGWERAVADAVVDVDPGRTEVARLDFAVGPGTVRARWAAESCADRGGARVRVALDPDHGAGAWPCARGAGEVAAPSGPYRSIRIELLDAAGAVLEAGACRGGACTPTVPPGGVLDVALTF